MATYYVNAATGNNAYDGLAETDLNAAIANRGPVADIQTGLGKCAAGDMLKVASGSYTAPSGGYQVTIGSFWWFNEPGVSMAPNGYGATQPVVVIAPTGTLTNIRISGGSIAGVRQTAATAGNDGIRCVMTSGTKKVVRLHLEDISVSGMSGDGIHLEADGTSDRFFVFTQIERCISGQNWGHGLYLKNSTVSAIRDSYFNLNGQTGSTVDSCQIHGDCSAWENNSRASSADATFAPSLRLRLSNVVRMDACDLEAFNLEFPAIANGTAVSGTGIPAATTVSGAVSAGANQLTLSANATSTQLSDLTIGATVYQNCIITSGSPTVYYGQFCQHAMNIETCPGATVFSCNFFNASESTDTTQRGIYIPDNGTGTTTVPDPVQMIVGPCRFSGVKTAIEVLNTARNIAVYEPFVSSGTGTLTVPNGGYFPVSKS